jgi:hypothetical protein
VCWVVLAFFLRRGISLTAPHTAGKTTPEREMHDPG